MITSDTPEGKRLRRRTTSWDGLLSRASGKRPGWPIFLVFLLCGFLGCFPRGELETDFGGVGVEGEVGGEGALGLLGDEAGEEVGFASGEHFLDVAGCQFLLEDGFAEAEAVGVVLGHHGGDHEGLLGLVEFGLLAIGQSNFLDQLVVGEVLDRFEV